MGNEFAKLQEQFNNTYDDSVALLKKALNEQTKDNNNPTLKTFTWKVDTIEGTDISRLEFSNKVSFTYTGYMETKTLWFCTWAFLGSLANYSEQLFKFFQNIDGIEENIFKGYTVSINAIFNQLEGGE